MLRIFPLFIFCFIICSCSDYNKQQAEKKAAIIRKVDSLNKEAKKMEDTIYKYESIGNDAINTKQPQ